MKKTTDLEHVVPSTKIYNTTAQELSTSELESLNQFFTKLKKHLGIESSDNPITIPAKDMNNIPETDGDRNYLIPKSAKLFRSGFYNSPGHTLESQTGIFAAQALHFAKKADADLMENMTKKEETKNYTVLLRKGNVVCAVNMYDREAKPTKEFKELIKFAEKHGFSVTKRGRF